MNFVLVVGVSLLISLSESVFDPFKVPDLIVLHLEIKNFLKRKRKNTPPADFEPTKRVLLVFLNVAGRVGLGSIFFSFLWFCIRRLGARSGLQY